MMAMAASCEYPVTVIPKAVPAAGGCSKSKTTIANRVMPNNVSGQPKRIIGGHLHGFFVGSCFAIFPLMDFLLFGALWHALAVGITLFAMVVLDFEHPPAAGTALGMTVTGYSQDAAVAIITSVILLAFISHYAKPFIRDLV